MGKVFGFFSSVADLALAMHDFCDTMRDLVEQVKLLRMDLKEEQQHRESIYRLLMDAKLKS